MKSGFVDTFSNKVSINIAFALSLLNFGIPFLTLFIISVIFSVNLGSLALPFLLSSFSSSIMSFEFWSMLSLNLDIFRF